MFGADADSADDATTNPWPAFADLLAATTLLFLVLFAAVALPAIIENQQAEIVRTRLKDLERNLRAGANERVKVIVEGDYLRIVIDGDATFPQGASELETLRKMDGKSYSDLRKRCASKTCFLTLRRFRSLGTPVRRARMLLTGDSRQLGPPLWHFIL